MERPRRDIAGVHGNGRNALTATDRQVRTDLANLHATETAKRSTKIPCCHNVSLAHVDTICLVVVGGRDAQYVGHVPSVPSLSYVLHLPAGTGREAMQCRSTT